jgi:L-ribulose-5-phosphate 3-epimerase
MRMTRRQVIAGLMAGAGQAAAQSRSAHGPRLRTTPAVCLYSQVLIKVPYDELGPVLKSLGVDGCDLSVLPGGHVAPEQSAVDLMRAIEAVTGVGLDVPVISTACTSLADPNIRNVAAIAGEMGVPLFRAGAWKYTAVEPEARLGEVQRDIAGLAALARAANMAVVVQNLAGDYVGASIWDLNLVIRGMDAAYVGYDLDIGYATAAGGAGASPVALRLVRQRLKMVTLRDFVWDKDAAGAWRMAPRPLGEGMVDFPKLFAALAAARFAGPVSLTLDYQPKDEISAIRRDVEFVRKQLAAAYPAAGGSSARQG